MTIAFDLDDTLYKERDFVASGRMAVARDIASRHGLDPASLKKVMDEADNAFDGLLMHLARKGATEGESIQRILDVYRTHRPTLALPEETAAVLRAIKAVPSWHMALVTDGRSLTQRNKIEALGLDRYFAPDAIIISEETGGDKHSPVPFETVMSRMPDGSYVYVGDNPVKDFHYPNLLGWTTVMLADNGMNVRRQLPPESPDYAPRHTIRTLGELLPLLADIADRHTSAIDN